jgi:hypothetical protein
MDQQAFNEGLAQIQAEEQMGGEATEVLDASVEKAVNASFMHELSAAFLAAQDKPFLDAVAVIRECVATALDGVVELRKPAVKKRIIEEAERRFDAQKMSILGEALK